MSFEVPSYFRPCSIELRGFKKTMDLVVRGRPDAVREKQARSFEKGLEPCSLLGSKKPRLTSDDWEETSPQSACVMTWNAQENRLG